MAVSRSILIGSIKTKLEDFANLGFLFLILEVLCCLSHNKRTRPQLCPVLQSNYG